MQILDSSQTAQALPYGRLVPAIARAALQLADGSIKAPERQVVAIDQAGIDWSRVRELSDLVAHGGDLGEPVPVLKTVGHAAWDLAAARVAVRADEPESI